MKPTEILSAEHRVILRVLACLERIIDAAVRQRRLDGDDARSALEFFRTFADACHHGKEEDHLFPKLVAAGLPADGGPVAVMLAEHDDGRAAVRGMLEVLDGAGSGDTADLKAFARRGRTFIELLRGHIRKEDGILFPMAANFLGPEAIQEVLAGYERAEAAQEPGTHHRMLAIAGELSDRYGVTEDDVDAISAVSGGCGHGGTCSPSPART